MAEQTFSRIDQRIGNLTDDFDIAVIRIPLVYKRHRYTLMPTDALLTREKRAIAEFW
jgi:hypothetical protein